MKFIKSERGQAEWALALILVGVVVAAIYMLLLSGNQRQMQAGADAIGETMGDAIDDATWDQEFENLVWEAENAVYAWKGTQSITPSKHAIERHGADAWLATNCYNNNGAFHVMKTSFDGIHLLCDDKGTIRDVIVKQRGKTNEFDFETAFTPKDGTLRNVLQWLRGKVGAGKFTMPENSVIYVDGVAP